MGFMVGIEKQNRRTQANLKSLLMFSKISIIVSENNKTKVGDRRVPLRRVTSFVSSFPRKKYYNLYMAGLAMNNFSIPDMEKNTHTHSTTELIRAHYQNFANFPCVWLKTYYY